MYGVYCTYDRVEPLGRLLLLSEELIDCWLLRNPDWAERFFLLPVLLRLRR